MSKRVTNFLIAIAAIALIGGGCASSQREDNLDGFLVLGDRLTPGHAQVDAAN